MRKSNHEGHFKQFCPRGHDTFICGRYDDSNCKQCKKEGPIKFIQFCPHGHDKSILGVYPDGKCAQCARERGRIDSTKDSRIKQVCINGHDISIIGRNKHGACIQCTEDISIAWRKENKEEISLYGVKYYKLNADKLYVKNRKWHKDHPEVMRAAQLKCSTNRSLRIVAWTDWDNILEFDRNKPKGMSLDHYIPLQGELVSGLHVSWNLQYLTPSQNSKKRNKCNLIEASEWYGQILKQAGLK
jgi:hypothetical protein